MVDPVVSDLIAEQPRHRSLEIWHNIMWSRYKALIFSAMAEMATQRRIDLHVFQIAETARERIGLGSVDPGLHRYPMTLLFKGNYADTPIWRRIWCLARQALKTTADATILAGYDRPEYILQGVILRARGKSWGVFCDSTIFDRQHVWWKDVVKRFVLGMAGIVFCYGQRSREYVVSLGVSTDRTVIGCQAAELPDSYDVLEVLTRRVAVAPAASAPIFLYVGRLAQEKGIDLLIYAFAQIIKDIPAARLRLIGTGPLGEELKALAQTLSVADKMEFVGALSGDDLYPNYLAATALILPSLSEPWGLVVNEALHFGCPVIVSDRCGCVPELVNNSACGIVFGAGSIAQLEKSLIKAPELWSDQFKVAQACLDQVSSYTLKNAGLAILAGAEKI